MSTKSGIPTGATLILTRMLRNLAAAYQGSKIAVVFDAKGKSFRSGVYPDYNANRPPMPEELRVQLEYVHRLVRAMGLPLISVSGVEADDVLGSYAAAAVSAGFDIVICTGDKDLAQLVNEHVILVDTMNNVTYDREKVREKYGVYPELIIDYLALKGDSSDNIPGMPGVGDVTAAALLNALGPVESIYARRSEIAALKFRGAKTFAAKLEQNYATVQLSKQLATIRLDVPLPLPLEDLPLPAENRQDLIRLFRELEFSRFLKEELEKQESLLLPEDGSAAGDGGANLAAAAAGADPAALSGEQPDAGIAFAPDQVSCHMVTDLNALRETADKIRAAGRMALFLLNSSARAADARIIGLAVAADSQEAFYIPLRHSYVGLAAELTPAEVKNVFDPVLSDPAITKIGCDLKHDLVVLAFAGQSVAEPYDDVLLQSHLMDSGLGSSLEELCSSAFDCELKGQGDYIGSRRGTRPQSFDGLEIERAGRFAGERAALIWALDEKFQSGLKADPRLMAIYREQELPCLKVLYKMEHTGALVDPGVLNEQNAAFSAEVKELEGLIYGIAGEAFNLASPKQLGVILFEKLGLPYPKGKAKTGSNGRTVYSTAEEVLQKLEGDYEIAHLLLRYRMVSKLISTYTAKLPELVTPSTGRIHASFNQAGTNTGRLSSSDPNLQNIPGRTAEGHKIRTAFTAPPGFCILSADYSQIELRLIAHFTQDPNLIRAFLAGLDIHRATAAEVLGKSLEEVTPEERSQAKATNFGLMYGMGAHGLSAQTGMPFKQAKIYIERYFARYPGVQRYMQETISFARAHGYVETLLGRQIRIAGIQSAQAVVRKGGERAAVNAPMQGSAAEIIKLAMIAIADWIDSLHDDSLIRMTLQVHDELVFEVKNEFAAEAGLKIRELMENAVRLRVPLTVGIGTAGNWGDAH